MERAIFIGLFENRVLEFKVKGNELIVIKEKGVGDKVPDGIRKGYQTNTRIIFLWNKPPHMGRPDKVYECIGGRYYEK